MKTETNNVTVLLILTRNSNLNKNQQEQIINYTMELHYEQE